jgi:UDP-glucuronate 4-epimerase
MKILVTGSAGFIGFHLSRKLLIEGNEVIGIDNLNNYYDKRLKIDRLNILKNYNNFIFEKIDITNSLKLSKVFDKHKIKIIVNLAAQAGVRYSLKKPEEYISTNIIGFFNLLEVCRKFKIKNLLFASTSSVYGKSEKFPIKEEYETSKPLQLYAATKKSNEVMAYSYHSLYGLNAIGLRFFTVYGPWGRPDMALYKFAHKILNKKKIEVYNNGNHFRDFTYIDDITAGIFGLIQKIKKKRKNKIFKIFNIGNNKVINLKHFIKEIEISLNIKAKKKYLILQKGDTLKTHSSIKKISKFMNYKPRTDTKKGIGKFLEWFKKYHKKYEVHD